MNNTFGMALKFTLFGESRGSATGGVLDGLPAGLPVRKETVRDALRRRRPEPPLGSARVEPDDFTFLSGIREGYTTGAPLALLIYNKDANNSVHNPEVIRPGHAEVTLWQAYGEHADFVGGGHMSGRLTAPLVALGSLAEEALLTRGIAIGAHVLSVKDIKDIPFSPSEPQEQIQRLRDEAFPVLEHAAKVAMTTAIRQAGASGDSLGGVLEIAVTGLPAGLGEPWFGSVESVLSQMFYAIPGVKGVSFGDGFALTEQNGSDISDGMTVTEGKINFLANHNGGILGGMTTGAPVIAKIAIKPVPTIALPQATFSPQKKENVTAQFQGRNDPCILPRAAAIFRAATALALGDLFTLRYGRDALIRNTP